MGATEGALKDAQAHLTSRNALEQVICEEARLLGIRLLINSVFEAEVGQTIP